MDPEEGFSRRGRWSDWEAIKEGSGRNVPEVGAEDASLRDATVRERTGGRDPLLESNACGPRSQESCNRRSVGGGAKVSDKRSLAELPEGITPVEGKGQGAAHDPGGVLRLLRHRQAVARQGRSQGGRGRGGAPSSGETMLKRVGGEGASG